MVGEKYMQYTYTAVINEKNGIFYAKVPDIDSCITIGKSLQEAILLITDALNLCLTVLEDEGIVPRQPTSQSDIQQLLTDILVPIQVDTSKYQNILIA